MLGHVADVEPSSAGLLRLIYGYQVSQAIHVAAALGIAEELADGPRAVDDLASATATHADALHRLLRALAAVEVLHEVPDGTFGLTALGEALRGPAGSLAAFMVGPDHWTAWGQLLHSVRTGENAFRAVHGMDVWEYRAQHPEEGAIFDAAMTGFSRRVNAAVAVAHDFSGYGVIVDVGGGHGALLAGILARHPGVRGVLFDQPAVVAGADADGFEIVGGSFFESVPRAATPTCSSPSCTTGRTSRRSRSCEPAAARPAPALRCSSSSASSPSPTRSSRTSTCSSAPADASGTSRNTPRCWQRRGTSSSAKRRPQSASACSRPERSDAQSRRPLGAMTWARCSPPARDRERPDGCARQAVAFSIELLERLLVTWTGATSSSTHPDPI